MHLHCSNSQRCSRCIPSCPPVAGTCPQCTWRTRLRHCWPQPSLARTVYAQLSPSRMMSRQGMVCTERHHPAQQLHYSCQGRTGEEWSCPLGSRILQGRLVVGWLRWWGRRILQGTCLHTPSLLEKRSRLNQRNPPRRDWGRYHRWGDMVLYKSSCPKNIPPCLSRWNCIHLAAIHTAGQTSVFRSAWASMSVDCQHLCGTVHSRSWSPMDGKQCDWQCTTS